MNNLLDWLLGSEDPLRDRRRSPRYPALPNRARMAWQEGGRTRVSTARLLNISGVGALVVADEKPIKGQAVWVRLEEPAPTEWVEARIMHSGSDISTTSPVGSLP